MELLEPKELILPDAEGRERKFILSKFPAVQGREIVTKYPIAAMPKLGDYQVSEDTMLKLMAFVAVDNGSNQPLRLSTIALVNNHCKDWETLAKIEMAMMEYNCSFFTNGKALNSLSGLCQMAIQKGSEILMALSGQSSPKAEQPFTNSEQSTL